MASKTNLDPAQKLLEVLPAEASDVRKEAFRAVRGGRPVETTEIARRTGLDQGTVRDGLTALAERGGVRLDDEGRVVAAGGLSLEPTRHRLILSGKTFHTWCAIDAVGIPAALGEDAVAETSCVHCGAPIEITIRGGGPIRANRFAAWLPHKEFSSVADELCPDMNLFCDQGHLEAWRKAEGDPPGKVLSVRDVARLGREWWADAAHEGRSESGECRC